MTQETSLEAYREVLPHLGMKQRIVYTEIYKATRQGFNLTNMELAEWLQWSINRVTPRVYELRELGRVVLDEKRVCKVTGRRAMAWRTK